MADANEPVVETTSADAPAAATPDEIAFLRSENKKAFEARQKAKAEAEAAKAEAAALRKAEKERIEQAELDRATKAGEFEKALRQLVEKHNAEKAELEKKATDAEAKRRTDRVARLFSDASDLFGPTGKYNYIPSDAERVFSDRVKILDDDSIAVVDATGEIIRDAKTGRPASFSAAMSEYIESLPDRQHRLRGSGKAGSGTSGGANTGGSAKPIADFASLTPEQRRDPKILEAIKKSRPNGGMVFGEAYNR